MRSDKKGTKLEDAIIVALTITLSILVVGVGFFRLPSEPLMDEENFTLPCKAAIVDQLSQTEPNETLIQTCTETMQAEGFSVDYYGGDNVTVDFYKHLPLQGYGLILFRVHSAGGVEKPLYLFTSECFDASKYDFEHRTGQIVSVGISETLPYWFGITPSFVRISMQGNFENTVILMMTCSGMTDVGMAEALFEKGASIYISWTGSVNADHNDHATLVLLQELITERQTIAQAVANTRNKVGPDPTYQSQLAWCPFERKEYTIPPCD